MTRLARETNRWVFVITVGLLISGISDHSRALAQANPTDDVLNVTLQTQDMKNVRFYDDLIKGKIAIINFFYAQCKGPCERGTQNLVQVQKALGDRLGREVFIYSITLRPEDDTPEVLKAYAETHGAKSGWTFLTGKAEDITALSRKLGLAQPDPDFIRSLKPVPDKDAAADKTIELKAANNLQPKATGALVGDVIEWKVGAGSSGRHGVRITNWEAVKDHVEVETVAGQQPFEAGTGKNRTSTTAVGKVLLRLKVKSVPPEKITYESVVPGDPPGEVSVGQRHPGMIAIYNGVNNSTMLASSLSNSDQILEKIARIEPPKR
jgi:cytochrome oxidase Cu insertion factor (SCO1/SenC/PrrC family)